MPSIHYQSQPHRPYAAPSERVIVNDEATLAAVAEAKKRILAREAADRAARAAQSAAAKAAKEAAEHE